MRTMCNRLVCYVDDDIYDGKGEDIEREDLLLYIFRIFPAGESLRVAGS